MPDYDSLEKIMYVLNRESSLKRGWRSFIDECSGNKKFEFACIGVCEGSNFFITKGIYEVFGQTAPIALAGFIGSVLFGGSYALWHVWRHGKKHDKKTSIGDALVYAATTESACVLGTSLVDYLAGIVANIVSKHPDPWHGDNLGIQIGGLIPAFAIGLAAMSGLTYRKKREAGRIIADKESLDMLHEELQKNRNLRRYLRKEERTLVFEGLQAVMSIEEKALPRRYPLKEREMRSLYIVRSRRFQQNNGVREAAAEAIYNALGKIGKNPRLLEDVFVHHSTKDDRATTLPAASTEVSNHSSG